jgi:hypothetical protein
MNNDQTPAPEQINTARDAVTLARLVLAGQDDATHDIVQSLLNDPQSIPGVFVGLCGLIAHALPEGTDPEVFFDAANRMLDAVENDGGGC